MTTAAKEEIPFAFESPRAALPLAAADRLAENSRQGFSSKKINSHQGWSQVNFKTAVGIEAGLRPKGIRSRCQSLNRYAYVMNNPTTLTDPEGLQTPGSSDPCGNHPYKAVCGGDAASSEAACMQAGLTPNCAGPLGSGELAAAEASYNQSVAAAFATACGLKCGQTQTINGVTLAWVPGTMSPYPVGYDQNGTPMYANSTGYWEQTTYKYFPDFTQAQINLGWLVGATFQLTVDKGYHVYFGAGVNFGKSASVASVSLTPGYMRGGRAAVSPAYLKDFLTKWGCSAGGGFALGGFFNWSGGGQAISGGFVTPQAGISCAYGWQLW